jgi:hypothetical protein
MALIHGSYSYVELGALIVWVLAMKCAAMDLTEMDRLLGSAVLAAMRSANLTIAQAVEIMKIDHSQFCKALRGEGYRLLSLNHLIKLGPTFMVHLTGELMWLTAKQRAQEIVETVSVKRGA